MSPKEQAIELVDKYYQISGDSIYDGITRGMAKRCALIAVDEILVIFYQDIKQMWIDELEYWHQVKNEIELL